MAEIVAQLITSDSRGPQFESSHCQNIIERLLSTVLKRRKYGRGPFLKNYFFDKVDNHCFLNMGHSGLFFFIFIFSTVKNKQMV